MYMKPCRNCPHDRDSCEIRRSYREKLSGIPLISINFRCDIRDKGFVIGSKVTFFIKNGHYDHEEKVEQEFCGTIVGTKLNSRLTILIDDEFESISRQHVNNLTLVGVVVELCKCGYPAEGHIVNHKGPECSNEKHKQIRDEPPF